MDAENGPLRGPHRAEGGVLALEGTWLESPRGPVGQGRTMSNQKTLGLYDRVHRSKGMCLEQQKK